MGDPSTQTSDVNRKMDGMQVVANRYRQWRTKGVLSGETFCSASVTVSMLF